MDNSTVYMAWGKCTIAVTKLKESAEGSDTEIDSSIIPVEDTTTLNVTEGDKTEATEEGGAVIAIKYTKDKYELEFATFLKITGLTDDDGVITGNYKVVLTPEEEAAPKLTIKKCHMKMTPSFSSADGWRYTYKCSALRPSASETSITIA